MRAILCKDLTGYQNLTLNEVETPAPAPNEALVKVTVTALNFFDTLITKGEYQFKPELPFSPGGEIAGTIEQLGANVKGLNIGDRVMAYIGSGGLREQIAVSSEKLFKIPDDVSDEVAASLSITYGTAMHGLIDRAALKPNQTVAITGAAGGAGLAAVEIARAIGANPIAIASSDAKINLAKDHGASAGIVSGDETLKQKLKAFNEGEGVDVIYDCVGGELAEPTLRALKWNGRYLVVGFASGDIPKIPLNLVLLKGIHISGVFWGRFIKEQPDDFKNHIHQLLVWSQNKILNPHIEAIYPLEQTIEALGVLANRKATGKILIRPNS